VIDISRSGRAIKNDPAIFALAILAGHPDAAEARGLIYNALPLVCRTGTHLFQFVEAVTQLRGWGRGLRSAVAGWYLDKDVDDLALQVTKYAQRNGWSHRDLLRLSHPKTTKRDRQDVFQYVAQREKWLKSKRAGHPLLVDIESIKGATKLSKKDAKRLIVDGGLVREHLPTELLNDINVWDALLVNMPATAMIRNLAKMTSIDLLQPLSSGTKAVCERLLDKEFLKKGRIHPFSLLLALDTYKSGHGKLGSLAWTPVPQIVKALEDAYYLAFDTVEPTGKNFLFGLDVSGSMRSAFVGGTGISAAVAAACLTMVSYRTEPSSYAHGFAGGFVDLGIHAGMSLEEVQRRTYLANFGTTDCSVPMIHAANRRLEVDAFVVLTDNETYAGSVHPSRALKDYNQKLGRDAKLIVAGMTATRFSIADPNDPNMLDVVGFDSNGPAAISEFVR
jgi:60 kDa SS-A/Ro ribonucleoprotein